MADARYVKSSGHDITADNIAYVVAVYGFKSLFPLSGSQITVKFNKTVAV